MNVLAFDTETTGFPVRSADIDKQPHVLQLALSLFDEDRRPTFEVSTLIRPPEGPIPFMASQAYDVHKISLEMCYDMGVSVNTAMAMVEHAVERASTTTAHNAQFDLKLLAFLAQRAGVRVPPNLTKLIVCTKELAHDIVRCPPTPKMVAAGRTGWKAPSLAECYRFFLNEELSGAHDALVDTRGCARVYFEIADRGMLKATPLSE